MGPIGETSVGPFSSVETCPARSAGKAIEGVRHHALGRLEIDQGARVVLDDAHQGVKLDAAFLDAIVRPFDEALAQERMAPFGEPQLPSSLWRGSGDGQRLSHR